MLIGWLESHKKKHLVSGALAVSEFSYYPTVETHVYECELKRSKSVKTTGRRVTDFPPPTMIGQTMGYSETDAL